MKYIGRPYVANGGDAALRGKYAAMRAIARTNGVLEPRPDNQLLGAARYALDFLMRGEYVGAGIADVLNGTAEFKEESVIGRIFREGFTNRGDKETFAAVFEQSEEGGELFRFGEGGRLSDIIGDNWLSRRGWDPTARGTIALGVGIGLDPVTWLGLGPGKRAWQVVSRGGLVNLGPKGQAVVEKIARSKMLQAARGAGKAPDNTLWSDKYLKAIGTRKEAEVGFAIEMEYAAHRMTNRVARTAREASDNMLSQKIARIARVDVASLSRKKVLTDADKALLREVGAETVEDLIAGNAIRFMGKRIIGLGMVDPWTDSFVRTLQAHDATARIYAAHRGVKKWVSDVFNKDSLEAREIRAFVLERQEFNAALFDARSSYDRLVAEMFKRNGVPHHGDFYESFMKFVDEPSEGAYNRAKEVARKYKMGDIKFHSLYSEHNQLMDEMWARDMASGAINKLDAPKRFHGRYVPHVIEGWKTLPKSSQDKVIDLLRSKYHRTASKLSPDIGRFGEQRHFDTFAELEEFVKTANETYGLRLKVSYDYPQLMSLRFRATGEAEATTRFMGRIVKQFARDKEIEALPITNAILPVLGRDLRAGMGDRLTEPHMQTVLALMERSQTVNPGSALGQGLLDRMRELGIKPDLVAEIVKRQTKKGVGTYTDVRFAGGGFRKARARYRQKEWDSLEEVTIANELKRSANVLEGERLKLKGRGKEAAARRRGVEQLQREVRDIELKGLRAQRAVDIVTKKAGPKLFKRMDMMRKELAELTSKDFGEIHPGWLERSLDAEALSAVSGAEFQAFQRRMQRTIARARGEEKQWLASVERLATYKYELGKRKYVLAQAKVFKEGGTRAGKLIRGAHKEVYAAEREMRREAARLIREARPQKLTFEAIKARDIALLKTLPDEVQAVFLHELTQHVKGIDHLASIMARYSEPISNLAPGAWANAKKHLAKRAAALPPISPYGQAYKVVDLPGPDGKPRKVELPESLADELLTWEKRYVLQPEVRVALRKMDYLTNIWKGAMTGPWPAFHFRNAYSNISQTTLDIWVSALHPGRHAEAMAIMFGKDGTMIARGGTHYTYGQVRSLAKAYGVEVDFKTVTEILEDRAKLAGKFSRKKLLAETMNPASIEFGPVRAGRWFGGKVENEARYMHFITLLRRGHMPSEAAQRVKKYLFDYSELSDFEKMYMRRIIPFYTWTSKNLRLQINEMMTHPGRAAAIQKPFRDRGPDSDLLPEYLRGDLRIRLEPGPGSAAQFLTGIDLPFNNLDILFDRDVATTMRQNLGMLNPIMKSPLEWVFDSDTLTGRSIRGAQVMNGLGPLIEKTPKWAQEFFELKTYHDQRGRKHYMMNGTKVFITLKSWALSRALSSSKQWSRAMQDDREVNFMWRMLTGMQFREFDLSEKQTTLLRNRYDQLEKIMVNKGLYLEYTTQYPRPDLRQSKDDVPLIPIR